MAYKKIKSYYITKDEEKVIHKVMPELGSSKSKNTKQMLYELQNQLQLLLSQFVNGGFSTAGYITYPLIKKIGKEQQRGIQQLKESMTRLQKEGFVFKTTKKDFEVGNNPEKCASLLASLYKDFQKNSIKGSKKVTKKKCEAIDKTKYKKKDARYLKPLFELEQWSNKNLQKQLKGFYLHGSFATRDYCVGFSDIDTLAIIKKETIQNSKELLKTRDKIVRLRKFLLRIDPLQHHGVMVISEYDLQSYCQVYFPTELFKYSKSIFRNDQKQLFYLRDSKKESLRSLFWFVSYFRGLQKQKLKGSYDIKNLLHAIALFPTLYLQAKGISVYKKYSFDIVKKEFTEKEWEVIRTATNIRKEWKEYPINHLTKGYAHINPIAAYQGNYRLMDYIKGVEKENKMNTEKLIRDMHTLSEKAWKRIKQKIR